MSAAKCGAEEKLTAYRFAHPGYACYRRTSLFHCAIARRDQTKCASSVAKFFVLDFLTAITMHLVYVDDSKDDKLACFSALLVPVDNWNDCLNRLINIRRTIKDTDQVPLRMELHATDWLSGKGSRVRHLGKPDRVRLFNYFLAGIAMLPGVQLINAAVPLHEDDRAFEWMMNRIDVNMRNAGSQAIIISDEGKSYDKLLRRMRRHNFIPSGFGRWENGALSKNLRVGRIIEDLVYRDSARSLFIQAADSCVYALLRSESPIPSKTALGLDQSLLILERIMVKQAFARCPKRLGIIR